MNADEGQEFVEVDRRNRAILFPYLNGYDVNSNPGLAASRWVINFHDWSVEQAKTYRDLFERVRLFVKPERDGNNRKAYRDHWWQFAERRPAMLKAIAGLRQLIVITRVSKVVVPVLVPIGQVLSEQLVVFATEDTALLALLSSSSHYWWAVTKASTLETRVRYTPSEVFETLPLPHLTEKLRQLGRELDAYRREVMRARQTGLTKTYNLVFDPNCTDSDIDELRDIHRAIDEATVHAYGWQQRIDAVGGLDHGFHLVGRETRYTIGPAAQRELLDSLLELNHERYADEVARGLHANGRRRGKRRAVEQGELDLGIAGTGE